MDVANGVCMANMNYQINLALVHRATFFGLLFPLEAVSQSKKITGARSTDNEPRGVS